MASADVEYRCFVGGLAWATDDRALEKAFSQFGDVLESKIINDRETGRSRGFGFVTFGSEQSMKDAIEGMNGQDLDGRYITVNEAQSRGSGGRRGGGGLRSGGGGGYGGGRREGGGGFSRGGGGYGGGRYGAGRGGGGYGAGRGGGGYGGGRYGGGDGIKAGKSELGGCRGYCGSKIGHCSSPGRGSDRSAGGARSDRGQNLPVGDEKWNKEPGPFPSRDQRADVGYGNTMGGFRSGSGLRYPRGQVPGHHPGGSNDRAPLEMSRPKSATAKGKWQKKELLQKADAARYTSDLYTAYKGPENKELTLSTESSEGGSGCIDLKKLPADNKEGIKAGKSEAQVKSEPENWDDAEDIRGEGSKMAMAKASASASLFTHLFNKVERDLIKPGDHIYSWRSAYIYAHHGIYAGDGKVIHFTPGAGQEIGTGTALDKFIFSSLPSHNPDNPCPNCGDQSRLDDVICSCLDCFLAGGDLYLFEYDVKVAFFLAKARGGTCTLAKSDPPEDVLHRASFLLKNGFGVYHIFKNNCEDFAIFCKTGLLVSEKIFSVPGSGQAASFVALATTVMSSPRIRFLTTNFGGLAVVGYFGGLAVVGAAMNCVSRLASDMGVRRDVVKVAVETLVDLQNLSSLKQDLRK